MKKFNDVLKELRIEKKLSQKELATELNISKSAISMYESGNREPNYETLDLIANYFNVDMNYLLGKTSNRISYQHDSLKTLDKPIMSIEDAVQFLINQPFITEMSNIDINNMSDEELIRASNIIADMIRTGLKVIEK